MIRKMLVSLCAIIAFADCHNKRTTEQIGNINDSIIVSYYPYMFESTERVTCSSMAEETAKIPVDSIVYLQMEDFNEIKAFVTMPHVIRDTIGCDSRMYVRYNKKVVCIGNISSCLCDMDGNKLESNSKIVYMIKWRAGYFNCFSEHELEFDETIGMFGIPIDYTYATERETDENSIKKLRLRKIAFLPQSESRNSSLTYR